MYFARNRNHKTLSVFLNPILLSCGDGVRSRGDFNDGRSEPVVFRFRSLVMTGTTLVSRIPSVWRKGTQSRGRVDRGHFRYRLGLGVQLHRNQFPNSTRLKVVIIHELYLGHRGLRGTYKYCQETITDLCTIYIRPVIFEVPSLVGRAPEKPGTVHEWLQTSSTTLEFTGRIRGHGNGPP